MAKPPDITKSACPVRNGSISTPEHFCTRQNGKKTATRSSATASSKGFPAEIAWGPLPEKKRLRPGHDDFRFRKRTPR